MYGLSSQSGYIHNLVGASYASDPGSQNDFYYTDAVHGNGIPNGYAQDQSSVMGYNPSQRRDSYPVVAFGFGGTFVVIRPNKSLYNGQTSVTQVFNMNSLVTADPCLEFSRLETKSKDEISRWVDERANCPYDEADDRNRQIMPLIWRVLKIAHEYNGKLRDGEGGGSNAALGQLILRESTSLDLLHCDNIVNRLRSLLMCGKTQSAIAECQSHQLSCGVVLLVASEMRNKSYVDVVTLLAQEFWSYLQCFCENGSGEESILQYWPEYLALAATGRTVHREFVNKLGDLLLTQGQIAGAQLCYLLAHDNWESFFYGKIRLLGADHNMYPRTHVTAASIKRTELYEHAKARENPENFLACFQPYKLVYAYLLAEIGLKTDALSYCRDILKITKGSLRDSELQRKAAELEDRLVRNLENGKSSLAGRVLSNTFNYVKSSLPTPRIARSSSLDSQPTSEVQSVWESDFKMCVDENTARPPAPGFLTRVSSSVVQKTASLIGRNKEPNQETKFGRDSHGMAEDYIYQAPRIQMPTQLDNEYQVPKPASTYTQYATWCKDGGTQLVRSLISPLPQLWKFPARKDQTARCEV